MSLVLQTLILPGFMSNRRTYVTLSLLFNGCYHLWRRTSVHFVVCNSGLAATSQIFVSPLRTISPPTPPRFLLEKSSTR